MVSPERLQLAREYAASIEQAVIDDPNVPEPVKAGSRLSKTRILSGELDGNFTVWQRMNYYLTGGSVPFLSK